MSPGAIVPAWEIPALVTHSFRRAFLYSAGFALLVVPLLGAGALLRRRRA